MNRFTRIGVLTLSAFVALGAVAASAQTKSPQPGPLVLEPSNDGPVFAPQVTLAHFDHSNGTLVGGYGGWLLDNRLLLGAGASFLVDHDHHDPVAGMGYGGFVAGWMVPAGSVLHAGVRGLVGFGQAQLTDTVTHELPHIAVSPFADGYHGMPLPPPGTTVSQDVRFWSNFFVFEPQASAVVRIARGVALDVAGGYRLVSGAGHYNGRLSGPSASFGVRFGPHF